MPFAGSSEEEIKKLEELLLAEIRKQGGKAGNIFLQREMKWDGETYWAIHQRLVDAKQLQPYRARGGAVALVDGTPEAGQELATQVVTHDEAFLRERALYEPVAVILDTSWAKDQGFRQHKVEVTANKGRLKTGGTWTRPDIVVAAYRMFPFLPGRYLDVITFEIKPKDWIDVTAVYEALAHQRAATQSYVWFHCPAEERQGMSAVLERIKDEADRLGVGVIVASSPGEITTWETLAGAERTEPDPELLNSFIDNQLNDETKREISLWVR